MESFRDDTSCSDDEPLIRKVFTSNSKVIITVVGTLLLILILLAGTCYFWDKTLKLKRNMQSMSNQYGTYAPIPEMPVTDHFIDSRLPKNLSSFHSA